MSSATAVAKILKDSKKYVSGEEIAGKLGVTRASVWKSIKILRETGFGIEATTNRGYRLVSIPDIPSEEVMSSLLNTSVFGSSIEYHSSITSTNDRAMQLAAEGAACGTVVTADRQTAGKARRGKTWPSPPGRNLYLSVVARPELSLARSSEVAAIASRALETSVSGLFTDTHFTNRDYGLFIDNLKIGGVLCEVRGEIGLVHYMAVGIGLNVSHGIRNGRSTSLFHATGKMLSRAELTVAVLEEFEKQYLKWLKHG